MRTRILLAAFLLGVGLCFVPVLGYGEIKTPTDHTEMRIRLLHARLDYIMRNPISFLDVDFFYDEMGIVGEVVISDKFGEDVECDGRIYIDINDNWLVFSEKSGSALLNEFERHLEVIFSCLEGKFLGPLEMDTDIVAAFFGYEGEALGYFYQGEYHLWGE